MAQVNLDGTSLEDGVPHGGRHGVARSQVSAGAGVLDVLVVQARKAFHQLQSEGWSGPSSWIAAEGG